MSIEKLAKTLQTLMDHPFMVDGNESIYLTDSQLKDKFPHEVGEMIDTIQAEADALLTNSSATDIHYENAQFLKSALGVTVMAGENDSFGLLSAVIVTPVGRIVYG